jgi:hypothetical protein
LRNNLKEIIKKEIVQRIEKRIFLPEEEEREAQRDACREVILEEWASDTFREAMERAGPPFKELFKKWADKPCKEVIGEETPFRELLRNSFKEWADESFGKLADKTPRELTAEEVKRAYGKLPKEECEKRVKEKIEEFFEKSCPDELEKETEELTEEALKLLKTDKETIKADKEMIELMKEAYEKEIGSAIKDYESTIEESAKDIAYQLEEVIKEKAKTSIEQISIEHIEKFKKLLSLKLKEKVKKTERFIKELSERSIVKSSKKSKKK